MTLRNALLFCLFSLCFCCLTSCLYKKAKKEIPLPIPIMSSILADMEFAEKLIDLHNDSVGYRDSLFAKTYFQDILSSHQVDEHSFDLSLDHYQKDFGKLGALYEAVFDSLQRREAKEKLK